MKRTVLACLASAVLCPSSALAQTPRVDSQELRKLSIDPQPSRHGLDLGDRYRLGRWSLIGETLADGTPVTDPLTQIVKVTGGGKWGTAHGTGFFLENCRVMTALHVLIMIKRLRQGVAVAQIDGDKLNGGENLVGETYEFETQPIPWRNGRTEAGRFIVLGHGTPDRDGSIFDGGHDWAVGYDEACLSESLNLGAFRSEHIDPSKPSRRPILAAGFPGLPDRSAPFYIDSNCNITGKWRETVSKDAVGLGNGLFWPTGAWSETSCSSAPGMSGGPLLVGPLRVGGTLLTSRGRLIFLAVGVIQMGSLDPDNGTKLETLFDPTGVWLFNDYFRESPLLKGPVDVAGLKRR